MNLRKLLRLDDPEPPDDLDGWRDYLDTIKPDTASRPAGRNPYQKATR